MKKLFTLKTLMTLLVMFVTVGAWADATVTFAFKTDADITYTKTGTSGGGAACEVTKSNVTLACTDGYTASTKTLSCYKSSTLTITAPGVVKSITATYTKDTRPFKEALPEGVTDATAKLSNASSATYTPSSSSKSVTLTNAGGGKTEITKLEITYTASTDPYIEANNVSIEADETSGEISYTIGNPADGVSLTAEKTTGDWISNVSVDATNSKVTFDATENETGADRTGTITLKYTGASDKVITVTQSKAISYTTYDKVSSSTMVIGGTYVWYGEKADGTGKSVATAMGSNTYLGAATLAGDSKVTDTQLKLTTETPQQFIFSQTSATDWTIADAGTPTNYLYVSDDKEIGWGTTANVWTLSGTDTPAFACSSYNSTAYTMFANLGSTRFNAYTASSSSTQDAILYHLNGEATSTLKLNDGTNTTEYTVKQGFAWVPIAPTKSGAVFQGWATTDGGEVAYAENAAYTMGTSDATLYAVWKAQTTKPAITTDIASEYTVVKGNSVTLTVAAVNADSYQWYSNTTKSTGGATAIKGATSESYTFTGTTKDNFTYIFCAVTNTIGTTNSTIATVKTVGSSAKQLLKAEYSNTFDAFITEPTGATNGKVQVYYMKGDDAPTLSSVKVSTDASSVEANNQIIVTAEDGTTAVYDVTATEVEPMTTYNTEGTFDGNETWIKNGYGFVSGKGIAFSKTDTDWSRESVGKTRIYLFVGPSTSVKLTNTLITSDRKIKVYVNGIEQTDITEIGKAAEDGSNTITITTSETQNNMIAIVSNQTGGDGGFTNYTISATEPIVTNANGVASYVTTNSLDFTGLTDITAYVATSLTASAVTVKAATIVPAGAAIVVKATDKDVTSHIIPIATSKVPEEYSNIFKASDGSYTVADEDYTYALNVEGNFQRVASGVTIPSGKAYLKSDTPLTAKTLALDFGDTDGISTTKAEVNNLTTKKMIKNGRLVIVKNNAEYNAVGAQVK